MISNPLFEGTDIRLTYIDLDKDPQIESNWSYDLDYVRAMFEGKQPRLLWPKGIKEIREKKIKEAGDNRSQAYFAIRTIQDEQLVGFLHIPYINITNHIGRIQIHFGRSEWDDQYGDEALSMGLRYVFDELNMYRVSSGCPEYAGNEIRRFVRFGLQLEVRQREAIFAHGRHWDLLRFGILEANWRENQGAKNE